MSASVDFGSVIGSPAGDSPSLGVLNFMNCPQCTAAVPAHVRDCVRCGVSVGYPNVRAAAASSERNALEARVSTAYQSADAVGYRAELEAFEAAVAGDSDAVMARSLLALDRLFSSANTLIMTFYNEVDAGGRVAEDNGWDRGRGQTDSLVNPIYFREIHYAALSLNGEGIRHYGDYHATLNAEFIAGRTTAFEENPFKFAERHRIVVGSSCPPGYRSSWSDRGKLAAAKLHARVGKGLSPDHYPGILITSGSGTGHEDFIEVHIFGTISAGTFSRMVVYEPRGRERLIWRSLKRKLEDAGVSVEVR